MRYLRAGAAALLLVLLVAGFPLLLAGAAGDPLTGWDALRAGDVSDAVLIDVLAAVAWVAWAMFAWAVASEVVALARAPFLWRPRPSLPPGSLPGPRHLAHALVTAVFLVLPSTSLTSTHHAGATVSTLHVAPTAATTPVGHGPARPATAHPAHAATGPHTVTGVDPAPRRRPMHSGGTGDVAPASERPREFGLGAATGVTGAVGLRELARLRRRQWRHRRPGRAVPTPPADVLLLEKTLLRLGSDAISDAARAHILAALANTRDEAMPPAGGRAPWDALCDAAGSPLPQVAHRPGPGTAPFVAAPPSREPPPAPDTDAAPTPAATLSPDQERRPSPRPPARPSALPPDRGLAGPTGAGGHRLADTALPQNAPALDERGRSVLSKPLDNILATTATTARDVDQLAPRVQTHLRRLVQDADPELDQDLADWRSPDTPRPRLAVLGPVRADARGQLPSPRPREAWHTEVLAYLAAHPAGVTSEKFGTDLWPDDPDITAKPKLRQAVFIVRRWLGTDPNTGREYLPQNRTADGGSIYRVDGVLTDAELFRRLRLRGVTRGPQGILDLEAALALVTGPAYDPANRRKGGYSWLADTFLDTQYTAMIIDVAHLIATHHLSSGRPVLAARAARVSLTAGSQDDIPLLDLVAASDAQGHHAEAGHWIRQILATHNADVEEDLPPRTAEILHRRKWHHRS